MPESVNASTSTPPTPPTALVAQSKPATTPKPAVSQGNWGDIDQAANVLAAAQVVADAVGSLGYDTRENPAYRNAEENFTKTASHIAADEIEKHIAQLDPAVRDRLRNWQWGVLERAARKALEADKDLANAEHTSELDPSTVVFRPAEKRAGDAARALASAIRRSPFSFAEIKAHFGERAFDTIERALRLPPMGE
jgi:hypothetical protein